MNGESQFSWTFSAKLINSALAATLLVTFTNLDVKTNLLIVTSDARVPKLEKNW